MLLREQRSGAGKVPPDGGAEHVAAILKSHPLEKAPTLRALLSYLWENRDHHVSEYAVGVEALGKRPDFDPKTDASVRVQISRLRQKLKEYYETEGHDSPYRVGIPLGGHHVAFEASAAEPGAMPAARPWRWQTLGPLAVALLLAAVCAALVLENRRLADSLSQPAALPRFWQSFLGARRPTSLIMPAPVFFIWDDLRFVARDVLINDYGKRSQSRQLSSLIDRFGQPALLQNYTVISDAVAAVKLAQYMERAGRRIEVASAPELSLDAFGDRNLILVGFPGTSDHIHSLLATTNFFSPYGHAGVVRNRNPRGQEPAEFVEASPSRTRLTSPGLVSLLPGRVPGTKLLLLVGRQTAALVSFLTNTDGLANLEKIWLAEGSPEYFEAVVQAEVEGTTPIKVVPVAVRAITRSTVR